MGSTESPIKGGGPLREIRKRRDHAIGQKRAKKKLL